MKNFRRALCLIVCSIFLSLTLFGCSGEYLSVLGNPSAQRFTEGEIASCVWDLHLFDDKIFLGSGDYDLNTRPTDVWAYDLKTEEFIKTGKLPEDAITRFVEIDGKLVAPGVDPSEPQELGNYYTWTNGQWVKTRTVPNAVHNFDMIKFDGSLFFGVGRDHGLTPFLRSEDNGQTFIEIFATKDGEAYDFAQYSFSRTYEYFVFENELYSVARHIVEQDGVVTDRKSEIFRYHDGVMEYHSDITELVNGFRVGINVFGAKQVFNGKAFFALDYLYQSQDMKTFSKIKLPFNERVSSFVIEDGVMYVLSFTYKKVEEKDVFVTRVYQTEDGANFTEKFCFEYGVPPISMVKVRSDFYLGMGNRTAKNKNNGDLILIKSAKSKTHSEECVFYVKN